MLLILVRRQLEADEFLTLGAVINVENNGVALVIEFIGISVANAREKAEKVSAETSNLSAAR